ncbi:MAG: imidazole glycerol phosphate synthase subunit HisH [Planctomycetota bacterium]|nr:imidazole glycerol phosphate synthase subunit HisH [Planctomycetota bacterium]
MTARAVTIISTGVANTASVAAAFRRCGALVDITDDPARVHDAARVVLPGVGSFGAGMAGLRARGLAGVIERRVRAERPLLAICLGLQMLCVSSEESPGERGLGLIDAPVRRFPEGVRCPQFGWNDVVADGACRLVRAGCAYYANSYRIAQPPGGWAVATTDHGGPFTAAVERGGVLGCQFHPELSGAWGRELLARWLECDAGGRAC